jgi:hypothetical protein
METPFGCEIRKETVALLINEEMTAVLGLVQIIKTSGSQCFFRNDKGSVQTFEPDKTILLVIAQDCDKDVSLRLGDWFPGLPGKATLGLHMKIARLTTAYHYHSEHPPLAQRKHLLLHPEDTAPGEEEPT